MDTLESLRMERRRCKTGSCPWYRLISQAKGQGIQITTMGKIPVVCKCSTFGELISYQLLFFAREPGELIAGAAAMIMKEEDNKNGHTDAACNKRK